MSFLSCCETEMHNRLRKDIRLNSLLSLLKYVFYSYDAVLRPFNCFHGFF